METRKKVCYDGFKDVNFGEYDEKTNETLVNVSNLINLTKDEIRDKTEAAVKEFVKEIGNACYMHLMYTATMVNYKKDEMFTDVAKEEPDMQTRVQMRLTEDELFTRIMQCILLGIEDFRPFPDMNGDDTGEYDCPPEAVVAFRRRVVNRFDSLLARSCFEAVEMYSQLENLITKLTQQLSESEETEYIRKINEQQGKVLKAVIKYLRKLTEIQCAQTIQKADDAVKLERK